MKKKLLSLTIFVITLISCSICLLAGCMPSRPDKFIQKLLVSTNWGIVQENDKGVTSIDARNGRIAWSKGINGETYWVLSKDEKSVEVYRYEKGAWKYSITNSGTDLDQLKTVFKTNATSISVDNVNLLDVCKNFTDKYEHRDGKWYERNTQPASFYVKGSQLIYEKGNKKATYVVGYKVEISKEAKAAKDKYLHSHA